MHFWVQIPRDCKVFPRGLTNGGGGRICNNRLLFKKNKLFFPIVLWKFLWGGQGLDGVGQSRDGDPQPPPPTWENHGLKN